MKTYTPAEQEHIIRKQMPQAAFRVASLLNRKQAELLNLGLHRGITLGVDEYGDASFHKTLEVLEWETDCELADAIFYQSIYGAIEQGLITV